ncbi:MAG TPA: hypothetical protein VFR47_33000 [Anaerolineales bacterium]|nr:hypothetical protein [Anaerolineales bacterium]
MMSPKSKRSLQDVVGKETYTVWVEMLRKLVPDGRTHRLSVVVAGMLHYATVLAEEFDEDELEEDSVALSLINANEMGPDEIKDELHDVMKHLFKDAGVTFDRVSKRGDPYSIADEAYNEYCGWFDYSWD